jgi:GLPGLI family protein
VKRLFNYIIVILAPLLLASGCESSGGAVDQGIITYDISYPRPIEDKWMEKLMPSEMEMQFKNNQINTELTFGLGMIKIGFISNTQDKQLHELLKFMRNRNVSHRGTNQIEELLEKIPPHTIELLPDTKSIVGFLCHKALVHVDSPSEAYSYDLWYTNDIEIKEPNWCTPFKKIPGVLMEYRVERFNVVMHFTAVEVQQTEIPDTEFLVPAKYKEISIEAMEKNLEGLKNI